MVKRAKSLFLSRTFQRALSTMTRSAMGAGATSAKTKRVSSAGEHERAGVAITATGPHRYRLFKPLGVRPNEKLPLMVMLHGCGQDAQGLSASSRMNRIAERHRFLVLYSE